MEFFDILVAVFSALFMLSCLIMIIVWFIKYLVQDREFKRVQKHYYEVMINKFEENNFESEDL